MCWATRQQAAGRQAGRQADKPAGRQADRQAGRQEGKKSGRQAGRQQQGEGMNTNKILQQPWNTFYIWR